MSARDVLYTVMSGSFHGSRPRSTHATLAAAQGALASHNRECACGGVTIVVRGPRADLEALGAYESESGLILDSEAGHLQCEIRSRTLRGCRGVR